MKEDEIKKAKNAINQLYRTINYRFNKGPKLSPHFGPGPNKPFVCHLAAGLSESEKEMIFNSVCNAILASNNFDEIHTTVNGNLSKEMKDKFYCNVLVYCAYDPSRFHYYSVKSIYVDIKNIRIFVFCYRN